MSPHCFLKSRDFSLGSRWGSQTDFRHCGWLEDGECHVTRHVDCLERETPGWQLEGQEARALKRLKLESRFFPRAQDKSPVWQLDFSPCKKYSWAVPDNWPIELWANKFGLSCYIYGKFYTAKEKNNSS